MPWGAIIDILQSALIVYLLYDQIQTTKMLERILNALDDFMKRFIE